MTIDQVNQEWWEAICKLQKCENSRDYREQVTQMKELEQKYTEMGYIKTFTNRWKEPN